jgi:Glycosyltransferase family 87
MPKKQTYLLIAFLTIAWLLLISVFYNNLAADPGHLIRWFNDHNDRLAYMQDGLWLETGGIPYRDVMSEYPQIPTYLFGLPFLFIHSNSEQMMYFWHSSIFSLLMLIVLFFTIRMIYNMLPERKWQAYLMLLPASLYFTYNRFDILPAFICLAGYLLMKQGKGLSVGVLLGIGTFTKWYPALLLPVFLSYDYAMHKRLNWRLIVAFLLTCLLIALPTILTAGWEGFLSPYRLHAGRGIEQVSLPALLNLAAHGAGWKLDVGLLALVFLALQFLAAPISLFVCIDSDDKLLQWTILVTGAFVLFSQIFSPQWILWLMPFLILALRRPFDLFWIILYNLAAYLAFPVGMDIALNTGVEYPPIFVIAGVAVALVLAVIVVRAIARARVVFSLDFFKYLFRQLPGDFKKRPA